MIKDKDKEWTMERKMNDFSEDSIPENLVSARGFPIHRLLSLFRLVAYRDEMIGYHVEMPRWAAPSFQRSAVGLARGRENSVTRREQCSSTRRLHHRRRKRAKTRCHCFACKLLSEHGLCSFSPSLV